MVAGEIDVKLATALCTHPRDFANRYTPEARDKLLDILFRSLTNDRADYLVALFPNGFPKSYSLQEAQGTLEETEYTEAARGHPCGHILKAGEATYRCSTCTDDPTAILCSRCFAASDHEGHTFDITITSGLSACCDCGDDEAWKRPVKCAIHSLKGGSTTGELPQPPLPDDLQRSIHATIARVLDYFCDVISCSPENLRTNKTLESVEEDELHSRLNPSVYLATDHEEEKPEYNILIWNDEKHTIEEVQDQVTRACRERQRFGEVKAQEANDVGRSIVGHSSNLKELLRRAKIIEEIKLTVTVRSARDTFREQMCGTMLDWLSDIAGCTIAGNATFLRQAICEEMLQPWNIGSQGRNAKIGREGLADNEADSPTLRSLILPDTIQLTLQRNRQLARADEDDAMDEDNDGTEPADDDNNENEEGDEDDFEQIDSQMAESSFDQVEADAVRTQTQQDTSDFDEMDTDGDTDFLDAPERLNPEQRDPGAPTDPDAITQLHGRETNVDIVSGDLSRNPSTSLNDSGRPNFRNVPRTPGPTIGSDRRNHPSDASHWTVGSSSKGKATDQALPAWEDLRKSLRLDAMIMFDLRLWKKLRINLRNLLIFTVVKIPQFKRILGLRFAGLYTPLAQLYLIADREPDHSIIHLSVQILTTPSIAEEVMAKANFLTNLMAILYTFLTTRQVKYPEEVDPDATLGFDAGTVANRRLYQFFNDLRFFLASPSIRERVRVERQYLMQYLDLAKLSQGICPNVRAVGEHVEYEADTWISASLLTREVNKLCRQLSEAYQNEPKPGIPVDEYLKDALRQTTITTILVCSGLDHQRYEQSEIKELVRFHHIGPFPGSQRHYKTVRFVVDRGTLSFHHPLHYTLSWLIENGKNAPESIGVLRYTSGELVHRFSSSARTNRRLALHKLYATGEDALMALFDYPLRVCVWLAQMRTNLWVRNGMSLRHQMNQYKGVNHRDLGYHRDLFLLQTALVTCDPERVLASMIDRFGLPVWMSGELDFAKEYEMPQVVELAEDFTYLLINMLSDRDTFSSSKQDTESRLRILRKDIAHTLCFGPLSYSELTQRLTERAQDDEQLQEIIEEMTTFKQPDGLNDSGLFELKPEFLQELDPYNSHFNKNQRDEAENIYKNWVSKRLNKPAEDIVLEPKLNKIESKAFADLCAIIHTPLFCNVVYHLLWRVSTKFEDKFIVSASKAESFLHVVLHLVLIATLEDESLEEEHMESRLLFVNNALTMPIGLNGGTIVRVLHNIWVSEEFITCRGKVRHILRLFHQKWPGVFDNATQNLDFPAARLDASSPANLDIDIEAKKKQAMERKARIMAQMQQQQKNFMTNQGMTDWEDDDLSEPETELPISSETRHWKFPSGVCIQCREETNDSRFYGTFAMVTDGHLLRETPANDSEFVQEILVSPENLDESNEASRPFGVSGTNATQITRYDSEGVATSVEQRCLSKGWPKNSTRKEPISTSCGHIMHFNCFENYYESVRRRHAHQIARRQPERPSQNEFVCPLCKALANVFIPVLYKSTEQSYPACLQMYSSFEMFTEETLPAMRTSFEILEANKSLSDQLLKIERPMHHATVTTFSVNAMAALSRSVAEIGNATSLTDLPGVHALVDLSNIFRRVRGTLDIVQSSSARTETSSHDAMSALLKVVANSIAAVEIGHRGRSAPGSCLVDGIATQTLSYLQVLCSSVNSYAATTAMVDTSSGDDEADFPYHNLVVRMSTSLFPGLRATDATNLLLNRDAFTTFVEASYVLTRVQGLPIIHLLRLGLIQELIRVAIWWLRHRSSPSPSGQLPKSPTTPRSGGLSSDEYRAMGGFVFWLTQCLPSTSKSTLLPVSEVEPLYRALRTFSLAFMRKAVLFLHVAHGVDFPPATGLAKKFELDRLISLCQLPDFTTVLSDFSEFTEATALPKLAREWITAWSRQGDIDGKNAIRVLHPAPFELIGLPQYYDTLLDECHKRKCPTTGKALSDPALCLFCGDIFCSQAYCCMTDKRRGGCNHHIENCSAPIGAYLCIRKCNIVLLDVRKDPRRLARLMDDEEALSARDRTVAHGSFFPAPYLTKHGETDQGLRTKHRLILNQKRYDKLVRDVWLLLNGSIWSAIARKLEGDVNAGGWESL